MAGKERSPNYPGLNLEAAIQAVQKVYDKERRSIVAPETVALALGHNGMTGPALMKLAALRQFGLVDDVSKGKIRVSEDALSVILRKPDDPEYMAELQKAALRPPLFAELYERYAESSDDALRYYLIKERGFSEEGATRVIKAFRSTVAFAKLSEARYSVQDEADQHMTGASIGEAFLQADARGKTRTAEKVARHIGAPWSAGGNSGIPLNVYIGPENLVQITFSNGDPSPDDIDALIEQLSVTKKLLGRGRRQPDVDG